MNSYDVLPLGQRLSFVTVSVTGDSIAEVVEAAQQHLSGIH